MSIVDPATGDVRFNPNFGSSGAVCCIAYTGKGDTIGVGLSRGLVKVINTATGVHHDLRQLDWYEMVDLRDRDRRRSFVPYSSGSAPHTCAGV